MRKDKIVRSGCSAFVAIAGSATLLASGCSFEFVNNNACQIFNCDTLFFLPEVLEGAANFTGSAGDGDMDDMDVGDDHDDGDDHGD